MRTGYVSRGRESRIHAYAFARLATGSRRGHAVRVPLTVLDYLDRAELALRRPDRCGRRARATGARRGARSPTPAWPSSPGPRPPGSTQLGVAHGERVAIVSQNSARLLTAFFGRQRVRARARADQLPPQRGRGRLHRRALRRRRACSSIPSSTTHVARTSPPSAPLRDRRRERRGAATGSASSPQPWDADEDATATINYTSGTTARPKGVQLTHRNLWLNAATFGWHMGVNDRDVYLHTLPMFHCNGWGMTYARHRRWVGGTSCCARSTARRSCAGSTRTASRSCAARPRSSARCSTRPRRGTGRSPDADRVRIVVAGAPPPTRTIERVETRARLGVQPDLRAHRDVAVAHHEPCAAPSTTTSSPAERARKLGRAGAPALGVQPAHRRAGRGARAQQRGARGLLGRSPRPPRTRSSTAGSTPATAAPSTTRATSAISDRKKDVIISGGENVSSIEVEDALCSHPAGRRGRGDRRARREVGRDGEGAWWCWCPGGTVTEAELIEHCRAQPRPLQVPDQRRVPRRAGAHRNGQTAEVQAARALLGRALRAP